MSLPDCTPTAGVYLCIDILPASAQRDIEILRLIGQLAVCDEEKQSVRAVIENTLTFYGINFSGWSGLVRRTCMQYNLPDPLQYLQYPWRPDRWSSHCCTVISDFWDEKLRSPAKIIFTVCRRGLSLNNGTNADMAAGWD